MKKAWLEVKIRESAARIKALEEKWAAFQAGAQEQMERDRFAWEKEQLERDRAAVEKTRRAFRVRKNAKSDELSP